MSWDRRDRRTLVDSKFIKVHEDSVILPGGQQIDDYTVVTFSNPVIVVAFDEHSRLLIMDEYRYALDEVMPAFPAGAVDESETPVEAARRELREETGYEADECTYIGELYEYPTKLTHKTYVVLARGLRKVAEPHYEATEQIEGIRFIPIEEVEEMIRTNTLKTAVLISAFYLSLRSQNIS